jgi:hypothetical protein
MLKRREAFTRFLDDGRICLTNNAAERALRGIALGRKSWLFAGSDRGGQRAAAVYSLIVTAKLNNVDPQAWLADVLARIGDHPRRASANSCPGTGGPSPPPEPDTIPPWRAGVADRRGHFIFNDRRELPCQATFMTCSPRPWPVASRSCVAMTDAPANSVQSFLAIPKARRKRSPTNSAGKADPVCRAVVNGDASGWAR